MQLKVINIQKLFGEPLEHHLRVGTEIGIRIREDTVSVLGS